MRLGAKRNLRSLSRPRAVSRATAALAGLLLCFFALRDLSAVACAGEVPVVHDERLAILNKPAPANVADLRAIESQVVKIADRVRQSTVALLVGDSQGSGVIVTENGLVLTAGHVLTVPGRKVTVVLADGRKVAGRALGVNSASDCGIVQITDRGPFPACKISDLSSLSVGDWCVGTGHPGGYQQGRPPVVRLGRVVAIRDSFLQSDCPLLGGDSGGPLFDLNGNIVGIHSRIGPRTTLNLHVSAALFVRDWDRLTKTFNREPASSQTQGMLGVDGVDDPRGARITQIFPRLPADQAGLKTGDVVNTFAGRAVDGFGTLKKLVESRRPGEVVELRVVRDNGVQPLRVTLVARPTD